jgi:hypothetical protein
MPLFRSPRTLDERGQSNDTAGSAAKVVFSRFVNHAIHRAGGAHHPEGQETSLAQVLLHPATPAEANQRNVLIDAVGVGLVGGVATFLSVFLVRLGASNFMVGLLTSMPALTGMILAMPIGEFLGRQRQIVPWFSKARLFVLSCYALTGLVPFFFMQDRQPAAIIGIWALATIPQTIVSVSFTVVMGGVAGERGRFSLMSRRWSILGITNSLTVLIVGQALNLFTFPLNYQVVFIGSAAGGLISYIFSSSIKLPLADAPAAREPLRETLRQYSRNLRANRLFVNFLLSQFLFRWGMALPAPLFPIYWVRNLNASDGAISAINGINTAVTMVAYFLWARATKRRGVRWVLLATSLGVSFYPLLTALTNRWELLVVWAGLAGVFSAGVDLVFFDIVLSTCPGENPAVYVAMYQTTVYIATFLAPLVGTAVAGAFGIGQSLILGTVLRLAGFALMALLRVGAPAHGQAQPEAVPSTVTV